MRPMNPSGLSQNFMEVLKSFYKVIAGNIGFPKPSTFDANSVPLTYTPDNTDGQLIRVGSITNPNALPNFWAGNSVATTITHTLARVPVGFIVCSKDKSCDIYNASPYAATSTTLVLYNTVDTADCLIYIF